MFFIRPSGPTFADGTQAEPALQAPADRDWFFDCSTATEYLSSFMPSPEHEHAFYVEAVRLAKRDHGTGTQPRA